MRKTRVTKGQRRALIWLAEILKDFYAKELAKNTGS